MSHLVDPDEIEHRVGHKRHGVQHLGRAVTAERNVFILHSIACKEYSGIDLRDCPYSKALDRGIDPEDWKGFEDRPVVLAIIRERLFPVVPEWLEGLHS